MPPPPPPPPASGDYSTAAAETTALLQPWSDFLDFAALSLPVSLSDATARLNRNLTHFQLNYAVITTAILLLSLIVHPISLLLLAVSAAAWYFLYFARRSSGIPLEVFGFTIDDRVVFAILSLFTFVALIFANVWFNLFVSIAISAVVVCLHGVLRVPSFGGDDPYGGLLDVTDGAYSEF